MNRLPLFVLLAVIQGSVAIAAEPVTINVWPGKPPGETTKLYLAWSVMRHLSGAA